MKERAEFLGRRIALYRRYLAEGVGIDLARHYLEEIVKSELELDAIQRDHEKWS